MRVKFFLLLFCIILLSSVSATLNVSLSDQGTDAKTKSTGAVINSGNLEVSIYDALTEGNLIYNETFTGVINNGTWNVMLGENESNPLSLEFGKLYYKDYKINGQDLDFTNLTGGTVERKFFYSPLGDISGEDISALANLTIANLSVTGNITASTGFFNLAWSYLTNLPNIIYGLLADNNANNLLISNGTAIGYNQTVFNNSIRDVGIDAGFNLTYNATYEGYASNVSRNWTLDTFNNWNSTWDESGWVIANYVPYSGATQNVNLGNNNFTVNGTTLHVNVNTGRVGIGTTNPQATLDVEGIGEFQNLRVGGVGSDHYIDLTTAGSAQTVSLKAHESVNYLWTTGNNFEMRIANGYNLIFKNNGASGEVMRIANNSNVGIGTSSPTATLQINSSNSLGSFVVYNASGRSDFFINGSSGNVGIGTLTPSQTLDVRGTGNFSGTVYINNATDVSTLGGGIPILLNNSYEVYFNQSYPTFINISNLLFVNKTLGNVGIGTTTPTEKLTVNGNVSLNNTLYVLGNGDVRIRTTGSANTNTFIINGSMTIGTGVGGSLEEDNDAILGLSRSATAGYGMLIFQTGSSTTDSWAVGMLDGEADFVFDTSYGSGTGKRLVIQNATGNIGIGTSTPTEKLMVNGSLRVQNSSGTLALYVNDSTGNIGIGTTTPTHKLNVEGNVNITGNLTLGGEVTGQDTSRIRVYRSGAQTIPNNADTIVQFQTEVYDNLGEYDNVTNYRFTAQQAGYYLVTAATQTAIVSWSAGHMLALLIYKNGATDSRLYDLRIAAAFTDRIMANGATIVYLAANDYIDVRIYISRGADTDTLGAASSDYFTVQRLHSPITIGGGNYWNLSGNNLYPSSLSYNVGIGTTSPTGTLSINSSNALGSLRVYNTTGSEHLFINGTSGKVGIGTTSPGYKLDVQGNVTDVEGIQILNTNNSLTTITSAGIVFGITNSAGNVRAKIAAVETEADSANIGLAFYTAGGTGVAPTEKMRILNNGNVGIGQTSSTAKIGMTFGSGTDIVGLFITNQGTGNSIEDDSGAKLTSIGAWTNAPSFSWLKQEREILSKDEALYILSSTNIEKFKIKSEVEAYGDKADTHIGIILDESPSILSDKNEKGEITGYSPMRTASVAFRGVQISLEEINGLNEKITALEQKNDLLQAELCLKDKTYSWCGG